MKRKIIAMLVISAMTLSVFAGCSKKADAPQAEAAAAEEPAADAAEAPSEPESNENGVNA